MIDMFLRQPLCFFRLIHIIVNGNKIKMPSQFATQDFDFPTSRFIYCTLLKRGRYIPVVPTESAQSRRRAERGPFQALRKTLAPRRRWRSHVRGLARHNPGVAAGFLSNQNDA